MYDVILYGATGFTGRLVAAQLARRAAASFPELRWAIAGRNRERLDEVARSVCGGACGVVVGDADEAIAAQARVVISTAGPFSEVGSDLVAACARLGRDYVDTTGETPWVRGLIDRHDDEASASGALIVPLCGFDSVPSDLLARAAAERLRPISSPNPPPPPPPRERSSVAISFTCARDAARSMSESPVARLAIPPVSPAAAAAERDMDCEMDAIDDVECDLDRERLLLLLLRPKLCRGDIDGLPPRLPLPPPPPRSLTRDCRSSSRCLSFRCSCIETSCVRSDAA
jgi:hypothetical protein